MITYYILIISFFLSLVGFFGLNTRFGFFWEDSLKRADRKKVPFSFGETLSSFTTKIEKNSISEFTGKDVLLNKLNRLDSDFYNILISFSPSIITGYVSYVTKSLSMLILSMALLFIAYDLMRVFNTFFNEREKGKNIDDSLILALGKEKFDFISLKKIDMFNETWIPIFMFFVIFGLLLKKDAIIMLFN